MAVLPEDINRVHRQAAAGLRGMAPFWGSPGLGGVMSGSWRSARSELPPQFHLAMEGGLAWPPGEFQITAEAVGQPAARIGDFHACPAATPGTPPIPHVGGPVVSASFNVITGKKPQARVTDKCICVGPPDVIVKGSATVYVNKLPAARMGDRTAHGGVIMIGMPTVLIGDAGAAGPADFGAAAGFAPPADAPCLKKAAAGGSPFVKA